MNYMTKLLTLTLLSVLAGTALQASKEKTYVVKNTKDCGKGSLRGAIHKANACGKPCRIEFCIPESDRGYNKCTRSWCIRVCSELPVISVPCDIDGYTQPGSCPNSNPVGELYTAHNAIELCGPGLNGSGTALNGQDGYTGITFGDGARGSRLSGLTITGFSVAIEVDVSGVSLLGLILGIAVDGYTAKQNGVSIHISKSADGTWVGNGSPESRNLIAGLGQGPTNGETALFVDILGAITNFGNNTSIQNTTVNLTADGHDVISTLAEVGIVSADNSGTKIGGPSTDEAVVVSGHTHANIVFSSTIDDLVQHVYAGSNATGTLALGGGAGLVFINRSGVMAAAQEDDCLHKVEDSLFSGNDGNGIVVGTGDSQPVMKVCIFNTKIGTDSMGDLPLPNGGNGLEIGNGIDTKVHESILNYNSQNGISAPQSLRTDVHDSDVSFNQENGVYFVPPCTDLVSPEAQSLATLSVLFQGVSYYDRNRCGGCRPFLPCNCYTTDSCGNRNCCT